MKKWILLLFFSVVHAGAQFKGWFTGPLIAPTGTVIPLGHFMFKWHNPVLVYDADRSFISFNPQFFCFIGLSSWCDLNIVPQFFIQSSDHQIDAQFGDLTVGLDFQILAKDAFYYFPGVKLAIREVFPTGKYELLSPKKLWTDLSGDGAFSTQAALILYKELDRLAITASAQYTIKTPVYVRGFNAFGGGFGASGTVRPGDSFEAILSFEYAFGQNWVAALDNVYNYWGESEFSGWPGISLTRNLSSASKPSMDQLSFALGLEYNFSEKIGIIGGYWFSVWSRNTPDFQGGVGNFVYEY